MTNPLDNGKTCKKFYFLKEDQLIEPIRISFSNCILFLAILVSLIFWPLNSSNAEDRFSQLALKASCQTSCHTAENLSAAKSDKTNKKECANCHSATFHSGSQDKHFFLPKALLTEKQKPNRRVRSSRPAKMVASQTAKNTDTKILTPKKIPGMAFIPAGEFIMGSNERWDDESPEHINSTGNYYIDLYETTNLEYQEFAKSTKHPFPHHWPNGQIPKGKEKHPVIYVSWFDARDYCKWRDKRLPTEEEWEKAARGIEGAIYPWGHVWVLTKSNNPYKNSTGTEPVGSYPNGKSPYGLYDMSGNVWEWVDDYYLPHPGNTTPKAEYGKDKRVLKGGSWFDCLSYGCGLSAPTFNRSFFNPEVRNNSFGFRCAKNP